MSNREVQLEIREIEYSDSSTGVDTWEVWSLSKNLLYRSANLDEVMEYIMNEFSEYYIKLDIVSLKWRYLEQKVEDNL